MGKNWDWKTWGDEGGGYANVAPWYGGAMRRNPKLKVFLAGGWYEAGHMMYLNRAALDKLTDDVRHFVKAAAPGASE
ncbi:hypothetical protein FBZ87_102473 [Nitrospirillum amazonense]|uniref:Serine carboxypeptidase n=1 Tax=Nitrospirillum amazonense TaxID=28077 RepID=A0A560KAJ0_9PROT|nr:hypothetical protein [Nitrospirillum amazonense]TWB80049.1 hypothetical protein FBZ87_102473 [Nitrospirillum amazonense]